MLANIEMDERDEDDDEEGNEETDDSRDQEDAKETVAVKTWKWGLKLSESIKFVQVEVYLV